MLIFYLSYGVTIFPIVSNLIDGNYHFVSSELRDLQNPKGVDFFSRQKPKVCYFLDRKGLRCPKKAKKSEDS